MTPTVLYGCEAWTLKDTMKRRLKAVQRKMLRMVLCSRRRLVRIDDDSATLSEKSELSSGNEDEDSQYELEPWQDFLTRVTRIAEEHAAAEGLSDWLQTWRRRQWRWARKVVTDDSTKWSNTASQRNSQLHTIRSHTRAQARPKTVDR